MTFAQAGGPGIGLFTDSLISTCVNSTGEALVAGDVVELDLAGGTATSDTGAVPFEGNVLSQFAVVVDVTTAAITSGIYGIALEAVAAGAEGRILFRGIVNANVATATIAGSPLVPSIADNQLALAADTTTTDGVKIVGISLEIDDSNLADILFNGVEGFGALTAV